MMRQTSRRDPEAGESPSESRFLVFARVLKPWGLRGDVRLQVLADHPEEFFRLETLYIGEAFTPCRVERFRWHRQDLLLKLRGYDDAARAETLRGQCLYVSRQDIPPLPPNTFYHYQLIGLKVITLDGDELGTLDAILETGANDVYVVHGASCGEILLPARVEVIRQVDLERGLMRVQLLPGLLPARRG